MKHYQHWPPAKSSRFSTLIAGLLMMSLGGPGMAQTSPAAKVWKDPNCGCCADWIAHLKSAGFAVQVFDTGNTAARDRLGMPRQVGSCHTAQIGGYAIEGHVPAADIRRLLSEAPRAVGLAAPGMPVGSPGMDGPAYGGRRDAYDVLLIGTDGSRTVYQSHR
ncbi:DUF411 domain-containing protein [Accumulibacter sp.]|uniref:DUF411 domain-containing protein n=1 Tax=Accumulibacter sp. TaxID=2053492 RepID=UPI002618F945|nr:DUF411 domain-containing protein [Accumulibacter sp.]